MKAAVWAVAAVGTGDVGGTAGVGEVVATGGTGDGAATGGAAAADTVAGLPVAAALFHSREKMTVLIPLESTWEKLLAAAHLEEQMQVPQQALSQ